MSNLQNAPEKRIPQRGEFPLPYSEATLEEALAACDVRGQTHWRVLPTLLRIAEDAARWGEVDIQWFQWTRTVILHTDQGRFEFQA